MNVAGPAGTGPKTNKERRTNDVYKKLYTR